MRKEGSEETQMLNEGCKTFKLTVPGKAKGQQRPRFSRKTGRAYEPKESAEAKQTLRALVVQEVQRSGWIIAHQDMPVELIVRSYREIPSSKTSWFKKAAAAELIAPLTKPDCDNVTKMLMDAMNGIVYHDDKQIFKMSYEAFYSETPRVEIEVNGYFVNLGAVKEKVGAIKPEKKKRKKT